MTQWKVRELKVLIYVELKEIKSQGKSLHTVFLTVMFINLFKSHKYVVLINNKNTCVYDCAIDVYMQINLKCFLIYWACRRVQ